MSADTVTRQIVTADEVAVMSGLGRSTILARVKEHGHVLGVAPVPDTGRRVVFSKVLIERALGLAS